jgi:RNA polymerase primary sigma factor
VDLRAETLFDEPETLADLEKLPATKPCFDRYREELAAFSLITAEEEVEVARRAVAGDAEALERLVCANLRFVVSEAKRWRGRGLAIEDLIAEGNVGLLTAARKFDPERGFKFISYAVHWIRQAILKALATQGHCVCIPLNQSASLSKLSRARARLSNELHREPTLEELAKATGLALGTVKALSVLSIPPKRLGAMRQTDSGPELQFDLPDDRSDTAQQTMHAARSEVIARALSSLSPREAKVLRLHYGFDGEEYTLTEIGTMLGVSRERIRQIKEKALEKLRATPELALEVGHEPATAPTPNAPLRRAKRLVRAA